MKCLFVLSVLLILLVLLRFYKRSEGFENSKNLIICKAEWCGHCQKAKDDFDQLAGSPIVLNDGTNVNVKILDADHDKSEISKYNVKGYPSILIEHGEEINEYSGPRTYTDIIEFLNR
jgi:hypothetical protein